MRLYTKTLQNTWRSRLTGGSTTPPPAARYALKYSLSPSRSDPLELDGVILTGPAYIFLNVPSTGTITEVRYYRNNVLVQTERAWPYDYAGGQTNAANPAAFAPGTYQIRADVDDSIGTTSTITYSITVLDPAAPTNPPGTPSSTRGYSWTAEEVAIWKTRSTNGPWKEDWDYAVANKNVFVANPSHWDGMSLLTSGTCVTSGEIDVPRTQARNMQCAAFYALVQPDTTVRELVRTELLAQVREPGLDFSNRSRFCLGNIRETHPVFTTAQWLTINILTYDYAYQAFTTAERTEINDWLYEAAIWYQSQYEEKLDNMWGSHANRVNNIYSSRGGLANVLYFGGPRVGTAGLAYNNRLMSAVKAVGMVGVCIGDSTLIASYKLAAKEFLKFACWPQGAIGDFERWESTFPDLGWIYSQDTLGHVMWPADMLARSGDREIYDFVTSEGVDGSEGGSKSLGWISKEMLKYLDGTYVRYGATSADSSKIIDGNNSGDRYCRDVHHAPVGNRYYRDTYVTGVYTRRGVGTGGVFPPLGDDECRRASFQLSDLFMFLHADMEDAVPFNIIYPTTRPSLYVDSRVGSGGNGTQASPYQTIQAALNVAIGGQTIEVVSGSGPYDENLRTVRAGTLAEPITLHMPSTVKFRGGGNARSFEINHSHIHVDGGHYDGLWDPANPNTNASYRDKLIYCVPLTTTYLTGIVIKPDFVGNCSGEAIRLKMTDGAEIGEFTVTGKGAGYIASSGTWGTNGEVVYIGTSPSQITENPGGAVDKSRNIWIHDIVGNISGSGYSELVNIKEGCGEV